MSTKHRVGLLMVACGIVGLGLVAISRVAAVEGQPMSQADHTPEELILETIHVGDMNAADVARVLRDLLLEDGVSYDARSNRVLLLMGPDRMGTARGILDRIAEGGPPLPPFEAHHLGVVVRLASTSESRKPFLRVDVSLYFPPVVGQDKRMAARVSGIEARDAMMRGLDALPPAEEMEVDLNAAMDAAEEAIKEAFGNAGLAVPTMVRFKSFVTQG